MSGFWFLILIVLVACATVASLVESGLALPLWYVAAIVAAVYGYKVRGGTS